MREPEDVLCWALTIALAIGVVLFLVFICGLMWGYHVDHSDQRDCRRRGGVVDIYESHGDSQWRCTGIRAEAQAP